MAKPEAVIAERANQLHEVSNMLIVSEFESARELGELLARIAGDIETELESFKAGCEEKEDGVAKLEKELNKAVRAGRA